MADNYTFAAGVNTYVPSLTGNLIVDYSRNPARFPLLKYTNVRPVEKQVGYYVRFRNEDQARLVTNSADFEWPDGNDAPRGTYNNNQHEFPQYRCQRKAYPFRLGYLQVEQAGWDVLAVESGHKAAQAMTARTDRAVSYLTTAGNWPTTNTASATTLGGGKWSAATSTNPYIKIGIQSAVNAVVLQTNGAVNQYSDFKLVVNPVGAKTITTSQEFIDFLKQSPSAGPIFEGNGFWAARYGLPPTLYGIEVVVEDTPKVTTPPQGPGGAAGTRAFVWPDASAAIITKQGAIQGTVGGGFNTFEIFSYAPDEMAVEVLNDPQNRVYIGRVIENAAEVLVAGESGYLVTAIS